MRSTETFGNREAAIRDCKEIDPVSEIDDHEYELVGEYQLGDMTFETLKCVNCGHESDGWRKINPLTPASAGNVKTEEE